MTALTQIAELIVGYQAPANLNQLPVITSSEDSYRFLYEFFPSNTIGLQEHFYVCFLNRANRVVGVYHTSTGGITSTVADPRLILGTALKLAASNVILAHNHPSGNTQPSVQDKELTRKLAEGAALLDLKVLDHLIVTPTDGEYCSFADEGLL